ncbi:threonine/serine exporter family protein [Aspergillus undulatus]|uniref:threonine/serine exporter family protein n=1 Tax=Aspergillus undulatus TaxID=1810928 RepID=UPI003CCDB4DD
MAGGYFDLPISSSSRRSSLTDVSGGRGRSPPGPRVSPLETSNENSQDCSILDTGGAQGKQRNAGILKSANRVKFTVSGADMGVNPILPSTSQHRADGRGSSLLQKPQPTASIPSSERGSPNSHSFPYGETSSSLPAGITIHSRDSSPEIAGADEASNEKGRAINSAYSAQERALKLASHLGRSKSPSMSPWPSLPSSVASTPPDASQPLDDGDDIPMIRLPEKQLDYFSDEDDDHYGLVDGQSHHRTSEAHQLVQQMTRRNLDLLNRIRTQSPSLRSGQVTPAEERDPDAYVERPTHYRGGILSSLLKLYDQPFSTSSRGGRYGHSRQSSSGDMSARGLSPDPSYRIPQKPRKWYEKSPNQSNTSLSGSTAKNSTSSPLSMLKRSRSSGAVPGVPKRWAKPQLEDEIRITVHIAELLSRQRYLIILCKALMKFGAPTHRLEEYMKMTARVLEINASFLYLPGCMIISFDDVSTHTTEVKLIRVNQGVDLGKLSDAHTVYKEVIHDVIGVEEAMQRLSKLVQKDNKYPIWLLILIHGLASASVGPFAFGARPIDMPIAFVLGCLLGILQLILSPRSHLYSNVFEISAAVLTSFLARAFGSIHYKGGYLFCFSALAQSSIALILPGYIVLCASLELQSRSMVAGSVRMVYAIIYSLFLGFGITIGTAVYGLLDGNASSEYTCPPSPITNEYAQRFPFVIVFTFCLAAINQAKWRQMPMMLVIAFAGYVVNYFGAKRFSSSTQVAAALGAFVVGVMANLYSRLRHGLAAAAMLPAIFVLVPSGLAASGSLISGIASAGQITTQQTPYAVPTNGTQGFLDAANNITKQPALGQQQNPFQGVVFDIGYGMVQVAIGFTVGLFLAALVVYPLGKKRSGLFSF